MQGDRTIGKIVHLRLPGENPILLTIAGRKKPAGELVGFNWLIYGYPESRQDEEALTNKIAQLETCFTALVKAFSAASEIQDPYASGTRSGWPR